MKVGGGRARAGVPAGRVAALAAAEPAPARIDGPVAAFVAGRPRRVYWYGSKGMPAGLAFARWDAKESSFKPKCALPKSAWLSLSRSVAG